MFDRELKRIRDKIRWRQYVITVHADEEMQADQLTVFDLENCVLAGHIIQRQRDRQTGEWKYEVDGMTLDDLPMDAIVKEGARGKVVFITVYLK